MADIRPIFKARVSSFEGVDRNGDSSRARVIPLVGGDIVTRPLALHWSVRGSMGQLAVGDVVWCARSEDGDGIVLCRADGEWAGLVPGSVTVEGDLTADGVSVSTHTHTGSEGETSGPH